MNAGPSSELRAILNRTELHCRAAVGDRWGPFGKWGPLGMRRQQGLRCLVAERAWAALGFAFPGVALPKAPTTAPIHGPMGRHDDDDLPEPEACGTISANSTGVLPPRPDVLYSIPYTTHSSSSLRPMLH